MAKPILVPGLPGDLLLVFETAHDRVLALKREDEGNEHDVRDKAHGIARATLIALRAWLGEIPVPMDDEVVE